MSGRSTREAGLEGQPRCFATTRWSVVLTARDPASGSAREALASLCHDYWYPLYAYARRRGAGAEEARDLTQGFFAHLLEKDGLRHVDPGRGRFRSFLLGAFRNFMADEHDRASALKRGGGQAPVSIDAESAEGRYALEPRERATPESLFERRWALTLLGRAVERLREEHVRRGRERVFEALRDYLTTDRGATPYAEVARRLDMSEVATKVAVHRLRRRFRELLVEEIAQTVSGTETVDEEIRHLLAAL